MKNIPTNYKRIYAFFALTLVIGLVIPFSPVYARVYSQYARDPITGSLILLANNPLPGVDPRSPPIVASGLSISCAPTNLNAAVGQTVTWFSSVTGGSGGYLYMWSGTEGLSGNTSTVGKTYATGGQKFATLTVTSGNRQITVACGSTVIGYGGGYVSPQPPAQSRIGVSCYATPERIVPGETVTWLALVSGTTASTTYAWDGADGLTGTRPVVSKTYTTLGVKPALLTVTNGSEQTVAHCTNAVTVAYKVAVAPKPPVPPAPVVPETPKPVALDVQGLCAPSSAKATSEDMVTWRAVAVGGDGTYRFAWKGDDALTGEGASTSKQYETAGVKKASAEITSADKALTIACSPIEIIATKTANIKDMFSASAFFSWLSGPVGFILAAIFAIILGIFIALRKRSKEEKVEDEGDHVQ